MHLLCDYYVFVDLFVDLFVDSYYLFMCSFFKACVLNSVANQQRQQQQQQQQVRVLFVMVLRVQKDVVGLAEKRNSV
jgi:hypothetical protein